MLKESVVCDKHTERIFKNTGTSPTNNRHFDKNGFLVIKNLTDPKDLLFDLSNLPKKSGALGYYGTIEKFDYIESEDQVNGSLSRYNYPSYKHVHYQVKTKIEQIIGKRLYPTYYFDRFYYPGQKLTYHVDRPSCEISVSVNIQTNLDTPWPLFIRSVEAFDKDSKIILESGKVCDVNLEPGDGLLYKGCERPHWREEMPTEYINTWYGKKVEKEGLFYHQIFFHYVLQDGIRAHYAFDSPFLRMEGHQ
jgi:hypothetical protein